MTLVDPFGGVPADWPWDHTFQHDVDAWLHTANLELAIGRQPGQLTMLRLHREGAIVKQAFVHAGSEKTWMRMAMRGGIL